MVLKLVWKSARMAGSATLTIVLSSTERNRPRATIRAACHLYARSIRITPSLWCCRKPLREEIVQFFASEPGNADDSVARAVVQVETGVDLDQAGAEDDV